ncbi:hypothetical protein EJK80_10725 [Corynebacterium phoceense]|uniref:Uncharacterized protein n=1 Tax=Corynebacterium phoceense TaxID=1686286 RepID=A0A540R4U8_9CORY|nr:hypothetical protein EJK80_10725 [Corynebacterium phoceense]
MARLRPTTKAQISGHRFLQRRLEHGLVLGDIRMIHDPLARRSRAAWISVGLSVLIAAGAGLIAWLQPNRIRVRNPSSALRRARSSLISTAPSTPSPTSSRPVYSPVRLPMPPPSAPISSPQHRSVCPPGLPMPPASSILHPPAPPGRCARSLRPRTPSPS